MRLIIVCRSCNAENKVKSLLIKDRVELAMKTDSNFAFTCTCCQAKAIRHVDEVKATKSADYKLVKYGCFAVALGVGFWIYPSALYRFRTSEALWPLTGSVITLLFPLVIVAAGMAYTTLQTRSINLFNGYRLASAGSPFHHPSESMANHHKEDALFSEEKKDSPHT